jgi:hypothetical protein
LKKKTHKLSINADYSSAIIAISSHENDYRLSWAINKQLGTNFVKTDNLVVFNKKYKVEQEFSLFVFEDEDSLIKYHLVANKCDNGYLIPELSNMDFFIQIYGDISADFKDRLLEKLKNINIVTGAFIIDPAILKSGKRLIY